MKLLVIGAHPDDAELMFGGTINKYSKTGNEVNIIVVTDGSNWNRVGVRDKKKIIAIRKQEASQAAQMLGVKNIIFLDFPDGLVKKDELIQVLINKIRKINPNIILTHSEDEGHPDHVEVSRTVKRVCNKISEPAPITNHFWETSEPVVTDFKGLFTSQIIYEKFSSNVRYIKLDKQDIEMKVKAVLCHKSQFLEQEGEWVSNRLFTEAKFYGNLSYNDYSEILVEVSSGVGISCDMLIKE